jgi:hypothetical protein
MEDHGRRVQRKRGVRFNGGVVPAVLPIPAHGKHVIGENLTETQPGLTGFDLNWSAVALRSVTSNSLLNIFPP